LWLFLAPTIMLLIAAGVEEVWQRTRSTLPMLAPALTVLLLAYPVLSAGYQFLYPREREEVRPLLEYVRQRQRQGDLLYLYDSAVPAARYYATRSLAFTGQVVVGVSGGGDPSAHAHDLEKLRGRPRVWVLLSHVRSPNRINEESLITRYLDRLGSRLDAQRQTGASLYLYDLAVKR
jgi:hypothetical protein